MKFMRGDYKYDEDVLLILQNSTFKLVSLLLKEQIVFLGTQTEAQMANVLVAQLLYLNSVDKKQLIHLFIFRGSYWYECLSKIVKKFKTDIIILLQRF